MNSLSSDEIEAQIIEFLRTQLGITKRDILPNHSFFHDFGVDGDDAVELIQEYSAQFNVSVDAFKFDDYFGPEATPSPFRLLFLLYCWVFDKSKLPTKLRFTVKDLIQGVSDGKL